MISNSNPTSFAADTNALRTLDAFCNGTGTACKHFQIYQEFWVSKKYFLAPDLAGFNHHSAHPTTLAEREIFQWVTSYWKKR
jgi:hypothetical protein